MALFRNESNVETIQYGCPICHSDVKGNEEYMYYCEHCNILYRKEDLILDKRVIDNLLKRKIVEKFGKEKDKILIEEQQLKVKDISEKKQTILKDLKESKKYYISKKSNIVHMANCPYGKNIKKENKIILKTLEGTEKLKKCKCMTEQ
jgi:hypothetical protein